MNKTVFHITRAETETCAAIKTCAGAETCAEAETCTETETYIPSYSGFSAV